MSRKHLPGASGLLLLCALAQLAPEPARAQGAGDIEAAAADAAADADAADLDTSGLDDTEPQRCIRVMSIDKTEVLDEAMIVFRMRNDDIYVNRLRRSCVGLEPGTAFGYSTVTGSLCNADRVTVLEDFGFGLSPGASCALGLFEPISEDALAILKGEEDAAEITVVPIEVEQ